METLTVETPIPTVSSPVLTAYSTDSQEPSSDARLISKRVSNQEETSSLDNILSLTNRFEDILEVTTNLDESNGVEADISNMETTITASLLLLSESIRTILKVLKNKKDKRGIVIRNKARLVAQGHTQEEGIDYDEVFAHVARIEAIRLFLAYASFMGFTVYQMDVKSAFLYGTIYEEVYVIQPPGFQDPEFPTKVYKVEKAMYGLHQAPRACFGPLLGSKQRKREPKFSLPWMGEGSGTPIEPQQTPSPEAQSPSHTTHTSPTLPPITTTSIPTVTPSDTPIVRQYTRRTRIAQSSVPPTVADEPGSPLRDVSQREACPTDSGFIADQDRATIDKSSTLPYDSVPRVTSPAAVEGTREVEINRLKERVKLLEDREGVAAIRSGDDAPIKGRSMDEREEATERISDDSEEMATVLTSMDAATVLAIPTGSGVVPTSSLVFATATVVTPYRRRKGKEIMVESETLKKQKVQEQIDSQKYHQFASELPMERRIELITGLVKYQDNYAKIYKYQSQQRKPMTKKKKRDYYMAVIRSNLGWKVKDFRGMTFEEVEANFNLVWKQMEDFIPIVSLEKSNKNVNGSLIQSQEQKTVSYHKLYDILKQHQHEVNEIKAEKIARVANPLALVAQQQPVYHPTHYTQNSSTRSQQAATRNRGKAIVNSPQPIYDQEPFMVAEDDETSKDKEIDKTMALISLSFKKIYKPTNNNLRTSSNTSRANQNNSPRIHRNAGYENQRNDNVAGARENKQKRAKDAAYHREKMLLCKQEEAGIQLNTEQADWRDDTDDDELEDQE
nr:copia protein [Tanacetum cinerariifolium]